MTREKTVCVWKSKLDVGHATTEPGQQQGGPGGLVNQVGMFLSTIIDREKLETRRVFSAVVS